MQVKFHVGQVVAESKQNRKRKGQPAAAVICLDVGSGVGLAGIGVLFLMGCPD